MCLLHVDGFVESRKILCQYACPLLSKDQYITGRIPQHKRRDSEQWMHHRLLPHDLRERVRKYDQYKWFETRGVDEENLVQNLPKDLRRDIKRHLCLNLVRRASIVLFFRVIIDAPLVCFFPIFLRKYVFGHGGYAGPSICQYG